MKRSKLLTLTSVALAMLMLFTSCAFGKQKVKDIYTDKAAYPDENKTYTVVEKQADMARATIGDKSYSLIEMKLYDGRCVVYNVDTNSFVWSGADLPGQEVDLSLNSFYCHGKTLDYFLAKVITTDEADPEKINTKVSLFSATGELVASADYEARVEIVWDLLYFDGKCYRVSEDGKIAYAFDYATLTELPGVSMRYKNHYYEKGFGQSCYYLAVYDDEMKIVSKYSLPSYAGNNITYVVLKSGDIFLQYYYEVDTYTEDYTFFRYDQGAMKKFMLVTQIVDAKTGKAKDIKCDYLVGYASNLICTKDFILERDGIDANKIPVMGMAAEIVDKQVSTGVLVKIDNRGKISELGSIFGQPIWQIERVGDQRWVVTDVSDACYLVNEKGKVLGEVTNASRFGKCFYADGKIYDFDLKEIYNYKAAGLTVKGTIGDSLLLTDADNRLLLYTGSGEPVVLIDKGSEKTYVDKSWGAFEGLFIKNGDVLEIYNDQGTLLARVDNLKPDEIDTSIWGTVLIATKNAVLLGWYDKSVESVFYRVS